MWLQRSASENSFFFDLVTLLTPYFSICINRTPGIDSNLVPKLRYLLEKESKAKGKGKGKKRETKKEQVERTNT